MQAVYWIAIHPVNKVWLKEETLAGAGAEFFSVGGGLTAASDWTALRDRWEYAHAVRAGMAVCAFLLVAIAATG
jgi:hypothetical protein